MSSKVLKILFPVLFALWNMYAAYPESVCTDGEGSDFSKEWLQQEAKRISRENFLDDPRSLPQWVIDLDWDTYQSIRFRPGCALWGDDGLPFQVQFFHLGLFFHSPVIINQVKNGTVEAVKFSSGLFEYNGVSPDEVNGLGFAGFRVLARPDWERDFLSFLGASYFRAVGDTKQYGLSARGLAVNTGLDQPEEFPRFTEFWLERPAPDQETLVIHALLDSPSVTGAYTFSVMPGPSTVMDVEARLFPRAPIERIGIAPLTSMYLHGENDRRVSDDFRPEIHDSDGLAIWNGKGEYIWRPLVNPPEIMVNSFLDESPRGFGLLQRDRDFLNYQDDGAYYDKRPSLWVEPKGDWGRGAVQLVEIPTEDETLDNIVAFWNPAQPVQPGREISFSYRLHWGSFPPVRAGQGEAIATRIGKGGVPGQKQRFKSRKFVIDFVGGELEGLTVKDRVKAVVTASRGEILKAAARPIKELKGWRCNFDLRAEGCEPVNLRCYLRHEDGTALTETWLYQWTPYRPSPGWAAGYHHDVHPDLSGVLRPGD